MLQKLQQFGVSAMGVMSIREFNKNVSAALTKVEAGETIKITRRGKVIAKVVAEHENPMDDPEYRAKHAEMMALLRKGLPGLKGPASYEERTGR
jgi:antitoxin (DNA-binding transcriptional repressor) of toxin-antitoxin stability system